MIKKFLSLFIFLMLISNVSALTNLPDDNRSGDYKDDIEYSSTIIDNSYYLNSTDLITYVDYAIRFNNYPDTLKITFKDVSGNTLTMYDEVSIKYKNYLEFRFLDEITINTFGFYNNAPVSFTKSSNTYSNIDTKVTSYLSNILIIPEYNFNYDSITTLKYRNYKTNELKNFKPYTFNLSHTNTKNNYTHIDINYVHIGSLFTELSLCAQELNIIFKIIYTLLSTIVDIIKFVTVGTIIPEKLANDIKLTTCTPMSWLSILIGYLIFILTFIFTMGIVWFTLIMSCLIFIFAYIKADKNIYDTFSLFAEYFKSFIENVYIKPLLWFYEKVLLQIIAKLRGSG